MQVGAFPRGATLDTDVGHRMTQFDEIIRAFNRSPARANVYDVGVPTALSVPEGDPALLDEDRTIETAVGPLDFYVARPNDGAAHPGLIVIHDRLSLVPHFRDVARRLAKLGYVALAPDLTTIRGGVESFADADESIAALRTVDNATKVTQLLAAYEALASLPGVDPDRLGCIGFCHGGTMTWLVATHEPRLKVAVPYYGNIPPLEEVPNIEAPVLAIYGALDDKINAGIPAIDQAMKESGKYFEMEIYEGAGHAFYNDTNVDHYNAEAAALSWVRATDFLATYLAP